MLQKEFKQKAFKLFHKLEKDGYTLLKVDHITENNSDTVKIHTLCK